MGRICRIAQLNGTRLMNQNRMESSCQRLIRVCLVEDDHLFRSQLERCVAHDKGMRCVGSFADGESALPNILQSQPDVVVLDFGLPGMKGDDCICIIRERCPSVRTLVLSGLPAHSVVFDCLEAGADGFLDKDDYQNNRSDLLGEIRAVYRGQAPLSARARRLALEKIRRHHPHSPAWKSLTEREREVASLLGQRLSNKEIAQQLEISPSTVKSHVKRIFERLDTHDRHDIEFRKWHIQ